MSIGNLAMSSNTYPSFPNCLYSVVQKCHMEYCDGDGLNEPVVTRGTGFWMHVGDGHSVFVTNRHNIDPKMHDPDKYKKYELSKLRIDLKAFYSPTNEPDEKIHTFHINLDTCNFYYHPKDNVDVVIIHPTGSIIPKPVEKDFILVAVDKKQFILRKSPEIMDDLYFVGFHSISMKTARYNLPIFRKCSIASLPSIDYADEDHKITRYTCLVEGLSFGGSSGSIVIKKENHEIIGIMSGHWTPPSRWDSQNQKWVESHTGLSYFTKSNVIIEIMNSIDVMEIS